MEFIDEESQKKMSYNNNLKFPDDILDFWMKLHLFFPEHFPSKTLCKLNKKFPPLNLYLNQK